MKNEAQERNDAPGEGIAEISEDSILLAISNPARMRILGLLRMEGPMTVGTICEATHMAPGSVSFHLRKLSEAGMAEKTRADAADGDGRKSWWKATYRAMRPSPSEGGRIGDAEYAYRRAVSLTYESLYERYLDALNNLPREWREVGLCEDRAMSLTPEEMEQMCLELDAVARKWQERASVHDGDADGDGRRKVQVIMQTFPWIP